MRARPFADDDLPRLQAAMAGWIAEAGRCGYDHIGELPHRLYDNLRDRRPAADLVQVWEDGSGVAGVAITLRFGCAFDVFAAPALRGGPGELRMLRAAHRATARLMDPAEPYVLTDVFDCDTARIVLLEGAGFERFRVWDHVNDRDLREPVPEPRPPAGFLLRGAVPADAQGLAEARNAAFGEDWTGALYRSAMMDKPGYDPSREIVVEAPDGRVAAFAVYWLDPLNRTGHFEPVGTHPAFWRRGLAGAAMLHGLRAMRAAGMTLATVNHDAGNAAARALYRSLGFARRHETYGYRCPAGSTPS
ncbi:MAG: GNAT family N-acetyltransferase [Nonomuraea sp.]|nr:GNAT family N-acetyltransferase [Nonomuraea sp.]NUS07393.1 GNAT family N-acetyltransferase [Nonomuraea sp.]